MARHEVSVDPLSATADSLTGRLTRALVARSVVTVAAGVGLAVGTGSAAWKGLEHQARLASTRIGLSEVPPPRRDGIYLPDGRHRRATAVPKDPAPTTVARRGCWPG